MMTKDEQEALGDYGLKKSGSIRDRIEAIWADKDISSLYPKPSEKEFSAWMRRAERKDGSHRDFGSDEPTVELDDNMQYGAAQEPSESESTPSRDAEIIRAALSALVPAVRAALKKRTATMRRTYISLRGRTWANVPNRMRAIEVGRQRPIDISTDVVIHKEGVELFRFSHARGSESRGYLRVRQWVFEDAEFDSLAATQAILTLDAVELTNDPSTQTEIAQELGVRRQKVNRFIKNSALSKNR